jgi:hypothetical protein
MDIGWLYKVGIGAFGQTLGFKMHGIGCAPDYLWYSKKFFIVSQCDQDFIAAD